MTFLSVCLPRGRSRGSASSENHSLILGPSRLRLSTSTGKALFPFPRNLGLMTCFPVSLFWMISFQECTQDHTTHNCPPTPGPCQSSKVSQGPTLSLLTPPPQKKVGRSINHEGMGRKPESVTVYIPQLGVSAPQPLSVLGETPVEDTELRLHLSPSGGARVTEM